MTPELETIGVSKPIVDYMESPLIDDDIKAMFKGRLYFSHEVPMMQLIKELKLREKTHDS
jgi:hypothetical protein